HGLRDSFLDEQRKDQVGTADARLRHEAPQRGRAAQPARPYLGERASHDYLLQRTGTAGVPGLPDPTAAAPAALARAARPLRRRRAGRHAGPARTPGPSPTPGAR